MPIPAPIGLTAPSLSLGTNLTTDFTSVAGVGIINTVQPSISEFVWYTPTTSLGTNINTLFTTVNNGTVITISSAGTAPRYSFIVPSMSLGSQFSTFIYTSNAEITISAGGASAVSTQSWYTTSA